MKVYQPSYNHAIYSDFYYSGTTGHIYMNRIDAVKEAEKILLEYSDIISYEIAEIEVL